MSTDKKLVSCYNRGCGADFDPDDNKDDACRHHPGVPFFHDAYKGWTCCNKKSVDFTEFLNIKGCERTRHSNVKPLEPVKPAKSAAELAGAEAAAARAAASADPASNASPAIPKPLQASTLVRPDRNAPLVQLVPIVAPALQLAIDNLVPLISCGSSGSPIGDVKFGTICKNGGCGQAYESPATNLQPCVHHPGVPIFHEGLKYWSCCTKRTTDFAAFLAQKGCKSGQHKWQSTAGDAGETIRCRYDWHQTAQNVVLAIYAKMYHHTKSFVKASPVRLAVSLVFPQQNDAEFNMDLDLSGIIDVAATKVQFFGTKVEVTLVKAEPGHWVKFEVPAKSAPVAPAVPVVEPSGHEDDGIESDVDLDDLEATTALTISESAAANVD